MIWPKLRKDIQICIWSTLCEYKIKYILLFYYSFLFSSKIQGDTKKLATKKINDFVISSAPLTSVILNLIIDGVYMSNCSLYKIQIDII